jgi:hypothetical protein
LKVAELSRKAILLPMFVFGDCTAMCSIFVAEIAETTNLKECPHTFVYIYSVFTVLQCALT